MKIKSLIALTAIVVFIATALSSCKKYEEGPALSLRSPMNRIEGEWFISFSKVNGELVNAFEIEWLTPVPDSSFFENIEDFEEFEALEEFEGMLYPDNQKVLVAIATFEKDGDGKFTFFSNMPSFEMIPVRYFSWSFDAEKENIIMNYEGENFTLEILRLTNKEMTLHRTETGDGTITTTEIEFTSTTVEEQQAVFI